MTTNRTTYRNGIDTAVIAPRFPLLAEIIASIKIGAAIGGCLVVLGAALQTAGYIEGPATKQSVSEVSIKLDGVADQMEKRFAELKTERKSDKNIQTAQMESLQDDMAGVRSEQRAFATAIEELKVKVSAPVPLPVRKPQPPRPKTASASIPKSLMIFGK